VGVRKDTLYDIYVVPFNICHSFSESEYKILEKGYTILRIRSFIIFSLMEILSNHSVETSDISLFLFSVQF